MDFQLSDEQKMVQQTVREFVARELMPFERWYREVRLWRIFEGTDEIQRFIIARTLLRGHVKVGETF